MPEKKKRTSKAVATKKRASRRPTATAALHNAGHTVSRDGELHGVAAYKGAVAAGVHEPTGWAEKTLVEERKSNGTAFTTPPQPPIVGHMFGASRAGTEWLAVGYQWMGVSSGLGFFGSYKLRTLIMRRGAASWGIDPSPNLDPIVDATGFADNWLFGVDAWGANRAWAVGKYGDLLASGNFLRSLIVGWDGTAWTVAPTTPIGRIDQLRGVTIAGANDAWAVGAYTYGQSPEHWGTLFQHWNGASWTPSAGPTTGADLLNAVTSTSASDLWAVGYSSTAKGSVPLILRGDGHTWKIFKHGLTIRGELRGVSAIAPNDVWAVGFEHGVGQTRCLILHWDGSKWSQIPSFPLPTSAQLFAVAAVSRTEAWAVGFQRNFAGTKNVTLVLHWNGGVWAPFPSI